MSSPTETPRFSTPQNVISPLPSSGEIRRRMVTQQNQPLNVQSGMPTNTGLVPVGISPSQNPPMTPFQGGVRPFNTPAMGYR